MVEAVAVLIPTGFFCMVAFIVFIVARTKSRQAELQSQVQARLVDRFSTAPGFVGLCPSREVGNDGFLIAGGILTAIGIGNSISTSVSLRLSRAWGLMGPAASTKEAGGSEFTQSNSLRS